MKTTKPSHRLVAGAALLTALVVISITATSRHDKLAVRTSAEPVASVALPDQAKPADPATPAPALADTVVLRPLTVLLRSDRHEWTEGDATSPEVVEKIAHNPDEFIRLMDENNRIKRRQLVYRKETVPMLLDQARSSGQPLKSFMLPGLDGREVEVEVAEVRLAANQQGGSVIGRVKGRMNSMVSVGFSNGCESFNVISPDDNLFLGADAREPGEVLVKEFDPEEYTRPPGSAPDFIVTDGQAPDTHKH